jgi:alpha-aminoadipate carrier protein LysW
MVTCPVCDADIDIEEEEVDEGESVSCDECGADLRVLGKSPLDLTPSEEVEDDEIYDDDDEEIELVEEEEEEEEEF